MFKTLLARARQGYRTAGFPAQEPSMPALFRGRPELYQDEDPAALARCVELCPTGALSLSETGPQIDLGRCIFCQTCGAESPHRPITFSPDWRLASSRRGALFVTGHDPPTTDPVDRRPRRL